MTLILMIFLLNETIQLAIKETIHFILMKII